MSDGTMVTVDPTIHIRYDGQTYEYRMSRFDIGPRSTDQQIKVAIATELNTPVEKLRNYTVVREENGNLTLRPDAVFG